MSKEIEHKYFDGRKYYLHNGRWERTTYSKIQLSYDIWNYYNPNDIVKEGDVIHHKNEDKLDDRIENLQKMTRGEHTILHHIGISRSEETKKKISNAQKGELGNNWKGGMKYKRLYLGSGTIEKQQYRIYQCINSLEEVLGSGFSI